MTIPTTAPTKKREIEQGNHYKHNQQTLRPNILNSGPYSKIGCQELTCASQTSSITESGPRPAV